jgi:uncharacterized protein YndB with AHSA1/START domain
MHIAHSIDIDAPPETVWETWTAIERWPEWTASISRIERISPGPFAVGLRARIHQPGLPVAIWQVTDIDEGHSFTWISASPGVRVTANHSIRPGLKGSHVTLTITFAGLIGRIAGWLTRSRTERYLHLEAAGLKARSETHGRINV